MRAETGQADGSADAADASMQDVRDARDAAPDVVEQEDAASDCCSDAPVEVDAEVVDPLLLAQRIEWAVGSDPDVVVDSASNLHVVYARDGSTYYRKVEYPSTIGAEVPVGPGTDPQVEVDSEDNPHVVMGALSYARWNGTAFDPPTNLTVAWRKPRLAMDAEDRLYVTVSRTEYPRVILFVLKNGAVLAGPVDVGQDNNGSISIDSTGLAHLVWRDFSVHYSTFDLANGASPGVSLHPSSDFSWCAIDPRDDSVHVVNTIRMGGGITYRYMQGGVWSDPVDYAAAEVSGVDDADNVGPTIAVDANGNRYVAFAGRDRIPYYMVVGPDAQLLGIAPLDAAGGSLSGGKLQNPNVTAAREGQGAYVAWGAGQVFVRGLGLAQP